MKSLHSIQEIIIEELNNLYEAFYVTQERIEGGDFLDITLSATRPLGQNAGSNLAGYNHADFE